MASNAGEQPVATTQIKVVVEFSCVFLGVLGLPNRSFFTGHHH